MSKNERSKLREHTGLRKKQKRQRKPDRRIRRTCERLGSALVALIQERPIDDVTVQDVLDRASVGRSTFYLHFRDKDDLLLSQLEKFLETMSTRSAFKRKNRIELCLWQSSLPTSGARRSFIACWPTLAVSTISWILRKAI